MVEISEEFCPASVSSFSNFLSLIHSNSLQWASSRTIWASFSSWFISTLRRFLRCMQLSLSPSSFSSSFSSSELLLYDWEVISFTTHLSNILMCIYLFFFFSLAKDTLMDNSCYMYLYIFFYLSIDPLGERMFRCDGRVESNVSSACFSYSRLFSSSWYISLTLHHCIFPPSLLLRC